MIPILDFLGHREGTDKASGSHNYLHWYERFLVPIRDKDITLLEIGVGGGPSLRMWRQYFQRAKIVGMDIDEKAKERAGERISIEIGDQGNEQDLLRVARAHGLFDVVVDDAGHRPEHQVLCFHTLLPFMRSGGLYILEDIGGGQCTDMLRDLAASVMSGNSDRVESVAFYRDTSITRIKDA